MFKTRLDTFGNDFGLFWIFENFSKTRPSMEHWAKVLFSKKTPQNKFKTRLDTFGNDFGLFWIFENFRRLTRPSMEHWAKIFSKKSPENMFKTRLDTFGNDFGHFRNFENILIFLKIFEDSLDRPWNTGQKIFSKKSPENMFKTRLDTFGNDFGHFRNFENFLIFLKIFEDSTVHGTLGKKLFRKNHLKTCSKHVWTLLGTILGILGISKNF